MSEAEHNGPERRDDDLVAAEYVLGVLPAQQRSAVARRIDSEPAFARLVDAWERRLAPMADAFEPADPPASVKTALDARLFPETAGRRAGLWSSLAFWRGLAAAAVLALAVFTGLAFFGPLQPRTGDVQRFVASLAHDDTDVRYLVVYDPGSRDIGLSHVSGARPQGQDFELWAIEGDNPPVSLGVIPEGQSVHLALSEALGRAIDAGDAFAISVEPPGGSPSGAPTGPVVAVGNLRGI